MYSILLVLLVSGIFDSLRSLLGRTLSHQVHLTRYRAHCHDVYLLDCQLHIHHPSRPIECTSTFILPTLYLPGDSVRSPEAGTILPGSAESRHSSAAFMAWGGSIQTSTRGGKRNGWVQGGLCRTDIDGTCLVIWGVTGQGATAACYAAGINWFTDQYNTRIYVCLVTTGLNKLLCSMRVPNLVALGALH